LRSHPLDQDQEFCHYEAGIDQTRAARSQTKAAAISAIKGGTRQLEGRLIRYRQVRRDRQDQ